MRVLRYSYAGIGSRETPDDILTLMGEFAHWASNHPTILRSGGALGADDAFIRGWIGNIVDGAGMAELYLPWPNYNGWGEGDKAAISIEDNPLPEAIEMAKHYHPNWGALKQGGRKLMGRNMHIVLGRTLDNPVDFAVCWTPGAKGGGGTGQAIRVCRDFRIPVFDLADESQRMVISDAMEQDNPELLLR
jgi:hypothetical protein